MLGRGEGYESNDEIDENAAFIQTAGASEHAMDAKIIAICRAHVFLSSFLIIISMGKKSRAAKAKGNTGDANASASSGAGVGAASGGTGHGAAMVTSKKAQKCVRCFGSVKADKGISCPGCSQLYCWRCEKKAFDACPNGEKCVHPIRRCWNCSHAQTFTNVMKKREGFICPDSTEDPEQFEYVADAVLRFTNDVIADDDALTNDATPEVACPRCGMRECLNCFRDPKSANIYGCDKCDSFLCGVCSGKELRNTTDGADAHVRAVVIRCVRATLATGSVSAEDLKDFSQVLRKTSANAIVCCHTPGCSRTSCVSCLDDLSMASMVESVLSHDPYLGEN